MNGEASLRNDDQDGRSREQGAPARARDEEPSLESYRYVRYLNHRLKNNLQVITSLLRLQEKSLEGVTAPDLMRTAQNRIRAIAMVYDRVEQSGEIALVDCASYLRRICDNAITSYKAANRGITLEFSMEPRRLDLETAVPLGQIVNELVSNSFRHAFEGAGKVKVEALPTELGFAVRVSDDGKGLPAGLDLKGAQSLGLRLVNLLSEQIRAIVQVESSSMGSSITLDVPDK